MLQPMIAQDTTLAHALRQHADSTLRQQVMARVDELGAKLGVAADHIWAVLVRQAYAEAAMRTAFFVIAIIVTVLVYKLVRKWWAFGMEGNDDENFAACAGAVIAGVATTVVMAVATVRFVYAIGYAINPEYFAFQQIVSFVK